MMNKITRIFCAVLLCMFCVLVITERVEAAPTCITLKFTDKSKYSDLSTADLLSDLMMETLMNERKFNFKEVRVLDEDVMSELYIKKGNRLKIFNECKEMNDFSKLFNISDFGIEDNKKLIHEAKEGDVIFPEIMSELSKQYGINHVLHCTINNIAGSQGNGTFIPIVNIHVDGAKYIKVHAYIRLIRCQDGKVVWGREIDGQAEKWSGNMSNLSVGDKYPDSSMYYNACNAVVKNFLKELNSEMISGKFKFTYD